MRSVLRLRAILVVAIKRLLAQPLLSIALTLGLAVAVTVLLTVPIYAESVAFRLLQDRLLEHAGDSAVSPFSSIISFGGTRYDPVAWEDTFALNEYLRSQVAADLGLEVERVIEHVETVNFRLYPGDEAVYETDKQIDFLSFATTDDIEQHIEIVEGALPAPADPTSDSIIEVMITEDFASKVGIQAGEIYQAYDWRLGQNDSQQITTVRIAGIWRALDATDSFWFYQPRQFNDNLLVPRETFANRIAPFRETEVNLALWYLVSSGSGITTSRVNDLLAGYETVSTKINQLLPNTRFTVSPTAELRSYQRSINTLTLLFTAFSVPLILLLLAFIVMVIGLSVEKRGMETAVYRSRGTTPFQVLGLAAVEGVVLGSVALLIGAGLAPLTATLLGSVQSFMTFSRTTSLRVSFPPGLVVAAGASLLLAVVTYLVPTISAARHTIISFEHARARTGRRPIWQRLGLDILLLALVAYFYYRLVQQGGLFINHEGGSAVLEDALDDPLLYLLPPATIFALSLFALRILPLLMRLISAILQLTNNVGLLIVTRRLERIPQLYYLPLLMLVYTIGLGIFMASFAHTIDRYLYEQQYYRYGADAEIRVYRRLDASFSGSLDEAAASYMDISEFDEMDHIESATRLGEYPIEAQVGDQKVHGTFFGVDRADFGRVSFWRLDFADYRLGYLMNALASQDDTVLVSRDLLKSTSLQEGDLIRLEVDSASGPVPVTLRIVGTFDYFPRWFPGEQGPLFVGNLDYLFEQAGGVLFYKILVRTDAGFDRAAFGQDIYDRGGNVFINEPLSRIARVQAQPERQGLFGILSIGFVASILVTVLGFFLYTLFAYQRRITELGILRAVGLSRNAMMVSVAWELGLLIVSGVGLGVALGLAASLLYIPFLQFSTDPSALIPPYVVEIAWAEIAQILLLFLGAFVAILAVLLVVLGRMRIFEAVKLGESV